MTYDMILLIPSRQRSRRPLTCTHGQKPRPTQQTFSTAGQRPLLVKDRALLNKRSQPLLLRDRDFLQIPPGRRPRLAVLPLALDSTSRKQSNEQLHVAHTNCQLCGTCAPSLQCKWLQRRDQRHDNVSRSDLARTKKKIPEQSSAQ